MTQTTLLGYTFTDSTKYAQYYSTH